jgi:hypothetical protein
MENKFKGEMEDHKLKLDREYEQLRAKFSKELERLKTNHTSELERHVSSRQHSYTVESVFIDYSSSPIFSLSIGV